MANRTGRRRFGNVRKLPSGKYQARYPGPDGRMRTAPDTFDRKSDADRYLTLVEAQIARREWTDPDRAKVLLVEYGEVWISQRPGLRPRTVELYRWLFGKHIAPYLGGVPLGRLETPMIREWRANLLAAGVSESMAAKAYRLLRAVLMTAVKEDEILARNPCRLRGADAEHPEERPVLSVDQVFALAEEMPARFRALVLLATFASLRWGEATALQRQDLEVVVETLPGDDLAVVRAAVHVRRAVTEQRGKGLVLGPPKSRAGRRTVTVPPVIVPAIVEHLDRFVGKAHRAPVFAGENGRLIWRGNFNKLVRWQDAVAKVGASGLHFHDLRHTGNHLAASSQASLRDLMNRMGHDSMRAALIYQHRTRGADEAIAAAVDARVRAARVRLTGLSGDSDDGAGTRLTGAG